MFPGSAISQKGTSAGMLRRKRFTARECAANTHNLHIMPIRRQLAVSFIEKSRQLDFWFNCLLFVLLGAALWPLTMWFAQTAQEQSRILHALIVLSMASVMLVRFGGVTVTQPLELNRSARRALFAAYGMLLLSYVAPLVSHKAKQCQSLKWLLDASTSCTHRSSDLLGLLTL